MWIQSKFFGHFSKKNIMRFRKRKRRNSGKDDQLIYRMKNLWPELREDTTFVPILKEWDAKQNVMKIEDK